MATPRSRAYTLGLLQNSAPKLVWPAGGLPMVVLCHRQPNRVFRLLTADKKLRQPVFLGLRDDKGPKEVALPEVPRE